MTMTRTAPISVVAGRADDTEAVVAISSRDADRPGQGNVSLVVGDGEPIAERTRLLGAIGLGLPDGVAMQQVHGGAVAVVDTTDAGRGMTDHDAAVPGADGLVTFATDVALMVMTADCVPVLLVDPGHGVAAAHAGRRGLASGVVTATLHTLTDAPGRVSALIGPAIGGCCYEVPEALADEVAEAHPSARATTTWGTAALDLVAGVEAGLRDSGVRDVARLGTCTRCSGERWFSHRRQPGKGRQAAVIARRSRPIDQTSAHLPDRAVEVTRSPGTAFLHWPS